MKSRTTVHAVIKTTNGEHYIKEDEVEMDVHDMVDYLTLKYVTKGSKWGALPVRFVTDTSREIQGKE